MTIRTRIAVIAASAVAIAVILVSVTTFLISARTLRSEIDESLVARVPTFNAATGSLPPAEFLDIVRPFIARGGRRAPAFDDLFYQVVSPGGDAIVPEGQPGLPMDEIDVLGSEPSLRDVSVDGVHMRLLTAPFGEFGTLQVARPLTEVDATLASLAGALLLIGIVGTALAGVIGYAVSRSAVRPIETLTGAAENVARTQDLDSRIEVRTDDEVGRLATSFNEMLAALEESQDQQRRLVRDAGHELRTPLTALRTNIEFLARYDDIPPDQRRDLLDAATAEVEDLSVLVNEVVDVASDRYADEPFTEVNLQDVVETAVDRAQRRSGHPIAATTDQSLVRGRPAALGRAVDNLLDNAVKWSPDGASVEVSVEGGRLAVHDHGPGIAADDRDLVFERFYRAPGARAAPGSGLGLSIVKQIVESHDGSVFAGETPGGGATVGFELTPMPAA